MFNITRYKIPTEFIVSADMEVLEGYISNFDSQLQLIAMESSSPSNDQYATMSAKARAAGKKIIEGQKKHDPSLVSQGNSELTGVTRQLITENQKAKSFGIKAKLIIVAKVIIAVIGSVFLAFGLYKAGKTIKNFLSGKASKQEVTSTVKSSAASVPKAEMRIPTKAPAQAHTDPDMAFIDDTNKAIMNAEKRLEDARKDAVDLGSAIDNCIEMTQNNLRTVIGMMASNLDGTLKTPVTFSNGTDTKTVTTFADFDKMMQDQSWRLQI